MQSGKNEERGGECSVGELTDRFGVTRKTLFYYDRIGLLKPSSRSERQNCKKYDREKVRRLCEILRYRDAGLQIAEIRILLEETDTDRAGIFQKAMERLEKDREKQNREISALKILMEEGKTGKKISETPLLCPDGSPGNKGIRNTGTELPVPVPPAQGDTPEGGPRRGETARNPDCPGKRPKFTQEDFL